jgi:hypothetical protein
MYRANAEGVMTIPDEVERSAMTETTSAQLAESLLRVADGTSVLTDLERDLLFRLAARRLEAMDEFMNFAEAALEHIDNPLIAMHLSAAIEAQGRRER